LSSSRSLFLDSVPDAYVVAVAKVMQLADWHTFQVLTKRADRMRRLLTTKLRFASALPNIWWGVSVEDKRFGVPRIAHLQAAPAAVRFLSIEPLLEDPGRLDLTGLGWVIVGGESGPGARPMEESWALSLRDQCARAHVPFFFKQWGGVQKSKRGRELEGTTHDAMPAIREPSEPREAERLARLAQAEKWAEKFGAPGATGPLAALRVRHAL
jgi:protein gp37